MNSRERRLRSLVGSVTPPREIVVAKITPRDVEDFAAGRLVYSDDTQASIEKRLSKLKR